MFLFTRTRAGTSEQRQGGCKIVEGVGKLGKQKKNVTNMLVSVQQKC